MARLERLSSCLLLLALMPIESVAERPVGKKTKAKQDVGETDRVPPASFLERQAQVHLHVAAFIEASLNVDAKVAASAASTDAARAAAAMQPAGSAWKAATVAQEAAVAASLAAKTAAADADTANDSVSFAPVNLAAWFSVARGFTEAAKKWGETARKSRVGLTEVRMKVRPTAGLEGAVSKNAAAAKAAKDALKSTSSAFGTAEQITKQMNFDVGASWKRGSKLAMNAAQKALKKAQTAQVAYVSKIARLE